MKRNVPIQENDKRCLRSKERWNEAKPRTCAILAKRRKTRNILRDSLFFDHVCLYVAPSQNLPAGVVRGGEKWREKKSWSAKVWQFQSPNAALYHKSTLSSPSGGSQQQLRPDSSPTRFRGIRPSNALSFLCCHPRLLVHLKSQAVRLTIWTSVSESKFPVGAQRSAGCEAEEWKHEQGWLRRNVSGSMGTSRECSNVAARKEDVHERI